MERDRLAIDERFRDVELRVEKQQIRTLADCDTADLVVKSDDRCRPLIASTADLRASSADDCRA